MFWTKVCKRGDRAVEMMQHQASRPGVVLSLNSLLRSVHGWRYVVLRSRAAINPTFEVVPGGIGNVGESGVGAGGPVPQE